jgi:dTDP-4-dehydrorhamnose reductase
MLVTGGSGFLGQHLLRATSAAGWQVVSPPSAALDVRRRERVLDEVRGWKPAVVVHLAYRQDDRRVIVEGSRNVAEAAAATGARLVHLSTDVVFPGRAAAYTEDDRPDATHGYGAWKAEAESAVADACPSAVMVRTSLLYGTDRLSRSQQDVADVLAGRADIRFFTDEYRCPAHAGDVAAAVIELASRPDVTGKLHVAGPDAVSRADLARAFAKWFGLDPSTVSTASLIDAAIARPGRVVLDCSRAASLGIRCRPLAEALST